MNVFTVRRKHEQVFTSTISVCPLVCNDQLIQRKNLFSHLQHVHHLLELSGFDSGRLLHGEALEVLDDTEPIDLSLLVLQQLLEDHTVGAQDLNTDIQYFQSECWKNRVVWYYYFFVHPAHLTSSKVISS